MTALSSALLSWPFAVRSQQTALTVVGFLDASSDPGAKLTWFYEGLRIEGFVRNQSVVVDYRSAVSEQDRLRGMAADLVDRKVAAIAAAGVPAALAARTATTTIPVVFAIASDPVQAGLVTSLNRPGGNVTGTTTMARDLGRTRIELLHETIPAATTFALLVNPTNPDAEAQTTDAQTAAAKMGLRVDILHARSASDLDAAFAALAQSRIGALAISDDPLFVSRSEQLATTALRHAVPAVFAYRAFAAAGGLMSYGSNLVEFYHQAGVYTGLILKGAKAADLPVFPSKQVELIVNLKTAKALGVTFPPTILGRADTVIE